MHTPRLSFGDASRPRRPGWRRLIAPGLLSLVVAACGGGEPPQETSPADESGAPVGVSPGGATVLDCVRQGYPCSFDKVPLQVIERSLALSDEVAGQLGSGKSIEHVATALSAHGDVVEVTVDGPMLGFRLAGGRPMIVDVTGEQEFLSKDTAAVASTSQERKASLPGSAAAHERSTIRSAATRKVVGGSGPQRRALVLSPFRYEANFGDSGELVAAALDGVRGYKGNVTYLATTDEFDPKVTVDVLTQLQSYDVIHVDTHGGTLCKKKETPSSKALSKGKDKNKCEDGVTDFLVQRFHGTARDLQSIAHPGVVHYRGSRHQSIAVTADFFRHYYPEGLANKLFILGSCNTFRTDMADAIAGNRGVYVSWDGYTEYGLVKNSSLALLEALGSGLTVSEAFARLPSLTPENPGAQGSALRQTTRRAGGDLRIRDLITVRDNLGGRLVTDTSGIGLKGVPDDGQNDHLDLEFTVDGISPEQLANFHLNLVIEGAVIGHLDFRKSGVQVGEFSYRISTPVPLPFDARKGQTLNMDFWVPLPDLGENHYIAAPKVDEQDAPQVGSRWTLSSRATQARTNDLTVKTASVVFEIEPGDDPRSRFHYFRVASGSVRIQRDYEDARGCRVNIDHTINLAAAAANNYLKLDKGSQTTVLDGFGSAASETIQATNSCGNAVRVTVGGVYFVAEQTPVSGDLLNGGYNDRAASPTIIEWSLSRNR